MIVYRYIDIDVLLLSLSLSFSVSFSFHTSPTAFTMSNTASDAANPSVEVASWEDAVKHAESLLDTYDIMGCYEYLSAQYSAGQTHPQVGYRLAKACYEMAQEYNPDDKGRREPLLVRGLEVAEAAVEADGNISAAHKWRGILLSEQYVATKEKIANAYTIRDEFLAAIQLDPNDATAFHCMGSWCFSICQIGWMERKVASLLFGSPPESTLDEALKYLKESSRLEDTIHNCRLIGDVLVAHKSAVEAMIWYQKATELPIHTKKDQREHDLAVEKVTTTNSIY